MEKKDIELTSFDFRLISDIYKVAGQEGFQAAYEKMMQWMLMGRFQMEQLLQSYVRIACQNKVNKIDVTLEQVMSLFNIKGYRDFQVLGNEEARGRTADGERDRLTWDKVFSMNEADFRKVTGSGKDRARALMERTNEEDEEIAKMFMTSTRRGRPPKKKE